MLAHLALAPSSLVHTDLARDLRVAQGILAEGNLPSLGPVLAGRFHLGPGWYYLLATLLFAGGGWSGGAVLMFGLSSLQFPLAYLAGKAWAGRSAGVIWSALLILPSWSLFESVFPTHTLLAAPTVLITLLAAGRFHVGHKKRYFILGALGFALAIHAHPSAVVLAPLVLGQIAHAAYRKHLSPSLLALGISAFILPFLPMILSEVFAHGSFLTRVNQYYSGLSPSGTSAYGAASLVWQVLGGGMSYWIALVQPLPNPLAWSLAGVNSVLLLLGIIVAAWRVYRRDAKGGGAIIVLATSLLVLVQIRELYPYYLTTAFRVLLLGTAAYGLAFLAACSALPKLLPASICVACLAAYLPIGSFVSRAERMGSWPFAFSPLLNVLQKVEPPRPFALQTARGISKTARWFCDNGPLALHGPYATALILDFGREAAECSASTLVLGGQEGERTHWIGLSQAQWQQLAPGIGSENLGAFRLVRAKRIWSPANVGLNPLLADYPPVPYDRSPPDKELTVDIPMHPGETLVVTHLGFPFVLDPLIEARIDGKSVEPATTDAVSWIYTSPAVQPSLIRLNLRASDPKLIDLAVF